MMLYWTGSCSEVSQYNVVQCNTTFNYNLSYTHTIELKHILQQKREYYKLCKGELMAKMLC